MNKPEKAKGRRRIRKWLIIASIPVLSVATLYLLWRLDAPPIENDYSISDLRSAPADCSDSYDLLLKFAKPTDQPEPPPSFDLDSTIAKVNEKMAKAQEEKGHGLTEEELEEIWDEVEAEREIREYTGYENPTLGLSAEDDRVLEDSRIINPIAEETLHDCAGAIDLAWEHAEKARAIIRELNQFAEIADETSPDSYFPEGGLFVEGISSNIGKMGRVYLAKTNIECERGNYKRAIEYLLEYSTMGRKLSATARSFEMKWCFVFIERMCIDRANYIINQREVSRSQIKKIVSHLPHLSDEQISLQNVLIFDYLTFKSFVYDQQRVLQAINKSDKSGITAGMLKPNFTLQLYKGLLFNRPYAKVVWPGIYPDSWSVWKNGNEWDNFSWQYKYYNPYGGCMVAITMQAWGRAHMIANNLKLTVELFHLIAKRRLDPTFDLASAVEDMGFSIDVEAKRIHKQEFDRDGVLDNEIALDIDPAVLGLEP